MRGVNLQAWLHSSRFSHITRPYSGEQIAKFQSRHRTTTLSHPMSEQLYHTLRQHQVKKTASVTFGALDPVQAVAMAPHVDTIYVSGWQSASTAASTREVGPDFADYPYNTVPLKVDQLMRALDFHDIKYASLNKDSSVNYMVPIIADADAGFGGVSSVMKVTHEFIKAGAAGIHLEDQRQGAKRCGHLGGKVLVPTQEQIERLIAARLQADIMMCPLVIITRTDAEAASLLDSNADPRDTPYLVGNLRAPIPIKNCTLQEAIEKCGGPKVKLNQPLADVQRVLRQASMDWEPLRTSEGYYTIRPGIDACITRGLAYAPYCDMIWMETSSPKYNEAKRFADAIRSHYPGMMLAYNLSPSFNWDSAKMTDSQIREFSSEIAKLGYCWQFITLAGFHLNGLATTLFARRYKQDKMLAYVETIQREERNKGVDFLKHQTWSGVEIADELFTLVTSGRSSTLAGATSTEKQFI